MDSQLTLFETPPEAAKRYRLFAGIFPSDGALDSISALQVESRDRFGLRGKFRPREILHVTLHHIDDYADYPERVIETAVEACASACKGQPSLEVTFDHVQSFRGNADNRPFVLFNPNGNEPLLQLHHRLITELALRKLAGRKKSNFVPHVTPSLRWPKRAGEICSADQLAGA